MGKRFGPAGLCPHNGRHGIAAKGKYEFAVFVAVDLDALAAVHAGFNYQALSAAANNFSGENAV